MHWSYSLPTWTLFHAAWQSVLCELAATESYAFVAYVHSEVLLLANDLWRAAWAGGLEAAVPGHNTGTVTQSLESHGLSLNIFSVDGCLCSAYLA